MGADFASGTHRFLRCYLLPQSYGYSWADFRSVRLALNVSFHLSDNIRRAITQMGYGLGTAMYVIFGVFAAV